MQQNEILVEIIAFNPSILYRCVDCEKVWHELEEVPHTHLEQVTANLPPDLAYEYRVVAEWVTELLDRFPHQIHLHVIDAVSFEGVKRSSEYGINFFPAVIVNRHYVFSEGMLDQATEEIGRLIEHQQYAPAHQH